MTQSEAPPPTRGAVRAAVEALLRTCADLERRAEEVADQSRVQAAQVTGELARARSPALTAQVEALTHQLDADLRDRLAGLRHLYVTEIHALLALLAPWHGLAPLPPLPPSPASGPLSHHFPAGFARNYVHDLLVSGDEGLTMSSATAGDVTVRTEQETATAKLMVADLLPDDLRDEGLELLGYHGCHAVERHGPHIATETQLARLLWRKDPAGTGTWEIQPNGGVVTDHGCGPAAGGFASAATLARTLTAFLRWAHDHAGGVSELIEKHTSTKAKRIGIHMSAALAGLAPGDTAGFRGTATRSPEQVDDWLAARRFAMTNGRPPLYCVPYDPISEGEDPGVSFAFKRVGHTWQLITCYPVYEQDPRNKRLEDLA